MIEDPSTQQSTPGADVNTVPMFSPEGKLAQVPQENYSKAIQNQFSPAIAVTSPEGQDAYLPHEKVDQAIKNYGFALGPSQQQPRVKMYTKSGQYAEIPENAQTYAQQQGWKPGIQMTSPLGIELTVHPDEAKKALDMGWGIGPAQQQPKPGFLARTFGGMMGVDSTDIANQRFKNAPSGKDVSDSLYNSGSATYGKKLETDSDILKYAGISSKVYSNLDDQQKNLIMMEAKARLGIPWEDKVAENLPIAGAMIRSGAKAVQSAKKGQYSEAFGHGLAAPLPLFGAQAEHTGDEWGQGHWTEGLQNAALTLAPFVAEPVVRGASKLDFSRTPRSPLSKVVMPDDVAAFHTAEELAKPSIAAAAKEVGVKLETADDLLQSVKQAKQNTLLDAHESAGPGKSIADLAPEDQQALSKKMAALDAVQKHVEDAQVIAKDAPEQPTKKEAAQRIIAGAAKMAGGLGLARMIPGGHWGLEIAGVGWGLKDLGGGLHDLVRSPILNETRLNGAIKDTFSFVTPEVRTGGVSIESGKPPFTPASDTSVEHTGNIEPPRTPHGETEIKPDEEPGEPETVSPYVPYTGNRAVAHETNVGPPAQPHGDLNVTPDETLYPGKPVINPPGPSDVNQVVSETDLKPSVNVPRTVGRDPKTGRFVKSAERGSTTPEGESDALSKLPRIQVGSIAGAQNDTALFQQAKQNLGPDATMSQIAQEAQRLKINQGETKVSTPPSNKVGGYNPAVETEGLPSSLKDVVPRTITDADLKKTYFQYDIPRLKKLLAEASEEDKPYYQSMIDQLTEKQKNMRGSGKTEEASQLPFFSRAAEVVKSKLAPWFSPDQALNTLKNAGVSADELDIVKPWLDQQGKKVQKQALLDHIENNGLKVNITMKGEGSLSPEAQKIVDSIKSQNVKTIVSGMVKGNADEMYALDGMTPEELSDHLSINMKEAQELESVVAKMQDVKKIQSDVPSDRHKFNRMMDQATKEWMDKHRVDDKDRMTDWQSIDQRAHELYKEAGGQYGGSGTQYEEYTLPGGKNYREMLIQVPEEYRGPHHFKQGHFEEPDVLAHVRMNDRTIDGKKTLFVEEVQSDWHQQGREKGYATPPSELAQKKISNLPPVKEVPKEALPFVPEEGDFWKVAHDLGYKLYDQPDEETIYLEKAGEPTREFQIGSDDEELTSGSIPDAPFKKDWHELAMKQVLDTAVREGYDQVGWTTGKQQIDRYEDALRKNVDEIHYEKRGGDKVHVTAWDKDENTAFEHTIPLQGTTKINGELVSLDDVLGKEMAQKVRESKTSGSFKGDDLAIGGSGMKGFYDEILPQFMNRYTKKWGGRVKDSTMQVPENREPGLEYDHKVHTIEITPKMKEEILKKGQPISGLTEKHEEVNA